MSCAHTISAVEPDPQSTEGCQECLEIGFTDCPPAPVPDLRKGQLLRLPYQHATALQEQSTTW
jgi:hypothetical protein